MEPIGTCDVTFLVRSYVLTPGQGVVLHQHVVDGQGNCVELFATAVERCSENTFVAECKEWTATLSHLLAQVTGVLIIASLDAFLFLDVFENLTSVFSLSCSACCSEASQQLFCFARLRSAQRASCALISVAPHSSHDRRAGSSAVRRFRSSGVFSKPSGAVQGA